MSGRYTSTALEDKVSRLKAQLHQIEQAFDEAPLENELKDLLVRQWQLLRLLESRPRGLRHLAYMLNVRTEQVQQDLRVLERAGFPVYDYRDDFGAHWWGVLRRAPARREDVTDTIQGGA